MWEGVLLVIEGQYCPGNAHVESFELRVGSCMQMLNGPISLQQCSLCHERGALPRQQLHSLLFKASVSLSPILHFGSEKKAGPV